MFKNPDLLTLQQNLEGYYTDLSNLGTIRIGDFLYGIRIFEITGFDPEITDVYILINLIVFTLFTFRLHFGQ